MERTDHRTYTRPGATFAPTWEEVAAFLRERKFLIGPRGGAVRLDVVDGQSVLVVDMDLDANLPQDLIDNALAEFNPVPDKTQLAFGYALNRLAELDQIPIEKLDENQQFQLSILLILQARG